MRAGSSDVFMSMVLTADHTVGNVQRNEMTASTQRQVRRNDLKREAAKINKRRDEN